MITTDNYGLKVAEGSDKYNHLTIDNYNYDILDETLKAIQNIGVPTATELKTGTVHAITRSKPDSALFRFTATSNYASGDTFTVDNTQVTALLTTGAPLGTGAYIIGSEVLCCLVGTRLTMFVQSGAIAVAEDSEKLGGQLPEYYATSSQVESVSDDVSDLTTVVNNNTGRISAIETKVTVSESVNILTDISDNNWHSIPNLNDYKYLIVRVRFPSAGQNDYVVIPSIVNITDTIFVVNNQQFTTAGYNAGAEFGISKTNGIKLRETHKGSSVGTISYTVIGLK